MQKHAYETVEQYITEFAPLPTLSENILYFDKFSVALPYSEDFPKLHFHDRYEVGICESGDGLFLSEGVFASVTAGDCIFIPPGCRHYSRSLDSSEPCVCRFAYVRRDTVMKALKAVNYCDEEKIKASEGLVPCIIRRYEYPEAYSVLSELISGCNGEVNVSASLSALRLSVLIIEASETFFDGDASETKKRCADEVASKALEYISLNYSGTETSKELAEKYHLSESQLRRRFVAAYGMPPIAYRCALRCRIAAELLTRTSASVSEITERIGYTSTVDLYKAFKKIYGLSPTEYRSRYAVKA